MGSKIVSEIELAVKANSKEAVTSLSQLQSEFTDLSAQIGKLNQFSQVLEGELQGLKKAADLATSDYEKFGQVLEFAMAQVVELRTGIDKIGDIENPFDIDISKPLEDVITQLGKVSLKLNDVFSEKQTLKVDTTQLSEGLDKTSENLKSTAKKMEFQADKATKAVVDKNTEALKEITKANKKTDEELANIDKKES